MSIQNRVVKLERYRAEIERAKALNDERRQTSSEGDLRRLLVHYSDEELEQIIYEGYGRANAGTLSDEELRMIIEEG